jgi:ubiquinone/menaquinone biosynthesis C-methylase UbiE
MNHCIIKNQMDDNWTAAEYNEIAKTIFFPIYPVIANQILKKADIDSGHCLEIGSGPGHLAIALATLSNLNVYAMDNSIPMCKIAQANVENYQLERCVKPVFGDINYIPYADASMNLVVSRGSVIFWKNLPRGFFECMRVLKPGCMAYIGGGFGNAHLRNEIVSQMRKRDPGWEDKQRVRYANCNPHIVRSALASAGINEYDIVQDESGYWICFTKGR